MCRPVRAVANRTYRELCSGLALCALQQPPHLFGHQSQRVTRVIGLAENNPPFNGGDNLTYPFLRASFFISVGPNEHLPQPVAFDLNNMPTTTAPVGCQRRMGNDCQLGHLCAGMGNRNML